MPMLALAILRESLALTRELFGAGSSALATDQVFVSEKLAELGLFDEAAVALAAGMPVILQRNGAQSTQYALALFNAGWLKYALGEFDAAESLLREALTRYQAAVDGRDKARLHVLRLAMALIEPGRVNAEARTLLDSVIAARGPVRADSIDPIYPCLPLAHWLAIHGEYAQAEALLDQVDAAGRRVEPELHARSAATRAAILRARRRRRRDAPGAAGLRNHPQRPRCAASAHGALCLGYARALRTAGETEAAQMLGREFRARWENAYPSGSAFRGLLSAR